MSYHTFEGTVHFYTSSALLFQSHYWEGALWFPRSQSLVFPDGDYNQVIKIKSWLCDKNDIQEFTSYDATEIEDRTYEG